MTITGTSNFVSFTKACDYYRNQGNEDLSPADLELLVLAKKGDGEITIGKPDVQPGQRLLVIDDGTRYAIEE